MKNPLFSLIVTSAEDELVQIQKLFGSLEAQTLQDFEIIFINQTEKPLKKFKKKLLIKEILSGKVSLSKARNIGLKLAEGKYIGFPDDDCYYSADTLEVLNANFKQDVEWSLIYANHVDPKTKKSCNSFKLNKLKEISFGTKIFSNSITIFYKNEYGNKFKFDEQMGVGTLNGSGEEVDFVINLLQHGYKGKFVSDAIVYHKPFDDYSSISSVKSFYYSRGLANLYCQHRGYFGIFEVSRSLFILPILGLIHALFSFDNEKLRVRWYKIIGIIDYFLRN